MLTDFSVEIFERIGIDAPSPKHYNSLRRTMNLVQARWSNRGINLWKVVLNTISLVPGQATYTLPLNLIDMLDTYIQGVGDSVSGESYVTDGNTVSGGLLDGTGATVTDGTQGFPPNLPGNLIGGGPGFYLIDSAGNPQVDSVSGFGTTQWGFDIILTPLSRSDYAEIPNKLIQGRPTSFWFNRTNAPTVTLWPVPNGTVSNTLSYYATYQMADAQMTDIGAQSPDIPYRMLMAYVADVAADMAMKYAPDKAEGLMALAKECWEEAATEDTEKTPLRVQPLVSGYWN